MARLFIMSQQVRDRWDDVLEAWETVDAAQAEVDLLDADWVRAGGLADERVHEYRTSKDTLAEARRELGERVEWLLAVGGRLDDREAVEDGREIVWDEVAPGPCH